MFSALLSESLSKLNTLPSGASTSFSSIDNLLLNPELKASSGRFYQQISEPTLLVRDGCDPYPQVLWSYREKTSQSDGGIIKPRVYLPDVTKLVP